MAPRAAAGDADARAASLFAVLLAAALLLHVLWWHGPVLGSPWTVVAAAAAWVLARPSSVGRLALLLAAASVAIVAELPALGTHLLLVLAVATCVLVHLGAGLLRPRRAPGAGVAGATGAAGAAGGRRPPTAGELWSRLAPFLRAAVVVLYVAAVLAKLNEAYLDPATSPAGPLAGKVAWFAPVAFDGDWRAGVAVWGSVLAEASLPVLLLVPRTRRAGLVVGLLFHGVLAATGTVPFTALMPALYVGFLPAGMDPGGPVGRSGRTTATDPVARRGRAARGLPVVAVALVVAWCAAAAAGLDPGRVDGSVLATVTRLVVLVAVLGAVAAVGAVGGGGAAGVVGGAAGTRSASAVAGRPRGAFLAGAVALVLCAASPYVGWRAGDAFTMYSGLRTSPAAWNHVLLPPAVRVRGRGGPPRAPGPASRSERAPAPR